ncbi:MAG: hypothetical protein WC346_16340, partial [Methanogenium sp.]
ESFFSNCSISSAGLIFPGSPCSAAIKEVLQTLKIFKVCLALGGLAEAYRNFSHFQDKQKKEKYVGKLYLRLISDVKCDVRVFFGH